MFQQITLYGNGLNPDLKSILICPKVANEEGKEAQISTLSMDSGIGEM